jgi:predicted component of type VI protein secretion system
LKIVADETSNQAPRRNALKRKKRLNIDPDNVTFGRRGRRAEVEISQNVKTTDQSKSRLLKVKIAVPTFGR